MVSLILVDRLGRKVLLLVSEVFMVVAMVVLGTFFYLKDNGYSAADSLGWLPLVSLIVFISAFAIGLGPMPWLMTGEVVPTRVKGSALKLSFKLLKGDFTNTCSCQVLPRRLQHSSTGFWHSS